MNGIQMWLSGAKLLARQMEEAAKLLRGDSGGHDFHGNQYKAGSGGKQPTIKVHEAHDLADLAKIAGSLHTPLGSERGNSLRDHVSKAYDAHMAGDKATARDHAQQAQEIAKGMTEPRADGSPRGSGIVQSMQQYLDTGNFRGPMDPATGHTKLGSLDAATYQMKSKNLGE